MKKLLLLQLPALILLLSLSHYVHSQEASNPATNRKDAGETFVDSLSPSLPNIKLRETTNHEDLKNAWFTGPILAPSPNTLPPGHFLAEPYVYDDMSQHTSTFGSLTYLLYGIVNRFTAGLMPSFGYVKAGNGTPSSSAIQASDLTIVMQYKLLKTTATSALPMMAVNVQQTFPTAKYDELSNPNDGFGAGAYTTNISLYTQKYFWLNNGRILRTRLNFSQAFSDNVNVKDASVYGTSNGFKGQAKPGWPFTIDAAAEYSLTKKWVLATDIYYKHVTSTNVSGSDYEDNPIIFNTGYSQEIAFAPAIEYNFNGNIGIIAGSRLIPTGHNVPSSVTAVMAVNIVY